MKIIGRKKSQHIVGIRNNIIDGDRIILKDALIIDGTSNFLSGIYNSEKRIVVFNFGEKATKHGHENAIVKSLGSNASCFENHGNQNCSLAFGINHGGCGSIYVNYCIDYNGYVSMLGGTDCSTFLFSDCCEALCHGHCWNEVMN